MCNEENLLAMIIQGITSIEGFPTSKSFDSKGRLVFDYTKSENYNSLASARKARESVREKIIPAIENWASEKFGPTFTKGFLTESIGHNRIFLKITIPKRLQEAYNIKNMYDEQNISYEGKRALESISESDKVLFSNMINEHKLNLIEDLQKRDENAHKLFDENGYMFNTIDEYLDSLSEEVDEMITNNFNSNEPNYDNYIEQKQAFIDKLDKLIAKIHNEKRINNSVNLTKDLYKYTSLRDTLEHEIQTMQNSINKTVSLKEFFESDFNTISNLISNSPSLENLYLAKDLFNYLKNVGNNTVSNMENQLFNPHKKINYSDDIMDIIKDLNNKIVDAEKELDLVTDDIFLKLLDKHKTNLSKLHPGKNMDEIKDEILSPKKDINILDSFINPVDNQMYHNNNILDSLIRLEYEKAVLKTGSPSQNLIEEINAVLPDVEKVLKEMGLFRVSGLGKLHYSGYDYRFMYQQASNGDYSSTLVGKFSLEWDYFVNKVNRGYLREINAARQKQNWSAVEQLLESKFNDINDNADFIRIDLLEDIVNLPEYSHLSKGHNQQDLDNYKNHLINTIGQIEYDNIISLQKTMLDVYEIEKENIIQSRLDKNNVTDISQLSDNEKALLEVSLKRLNPIDFIDSYVAGNKGRITYTVGTQTYTKPSYMKYNTFIPKQTNHVNHDLGYYDSNFKIIESNPALYKFWEIAHRSTHEVNSNLIDSHLKLQANSILHLNKTMTEKSLDKNFLSIVKDGLYNLLNVKQWIKEAFSEKVFDTDVNERLLPAEIKAHDIEVAKEFSIVKTELSNILDTTLTENTTIDFRIVPIDKLKQIGDLLGVPYTILNDEFKVKDLKPFVSQIVFERKTLNFPKLLKATLELSAEHKARTIAQNEVDLYMEKSASIRNSGRGPFHLSNVRTRAIDRQKAFYNRTLLNNDRKSQLGNITNLLVRMTNGKYHSDLPLIGRIFDKNFTKEEKLVYNSGMTRLTKINKRLTDMNNSHYLSPAIEKEYEILLNEKERIEQRLRILGKDYLLSALFNSVVNELAVKVGLGYNFVSNLKNKLQGVTSLYSRDGEFWSEGNIYPTMHFTSLNKLRFINPKYKKEWDKMTIFIQKLNLIQDMTNELQKAESKIRNKSRIFGAMYGTELVEYYNQVPGILAMTMDLQAKDTNGKIHNVFDGSSLQIFDLVDGKLALKPEFDIPENQKYLTFDTDDMIDWKVNVKGMIESLHGDYSKTGITRIKDSVITKPFMTFKTWLPKYYYARFRYQQQNIKTGEIEDGYLISSMLNSKTSIAGGGLLALTAGVGFLSVLPYASVTIGGAAALTGFIQYVRGRRSKNQNDPNQVDTNFLRTNGPILDLAEPINMMEQLKYVMKVIATTPRVPINAIVGKDLIKKNELNKSLNLTPQEQKDLELLAKNFQNTLMLMLVKITIQSLLAFNDDDEPKGSPGSEQRKKYEKQQAEKRAYKEKHNFLENIITGMYQECNLALEPTTLYFNHISKNGYSNFLEKMENYNKALISYSQGKDVIQKGDKKGQSKLGNQFRKELPSLFRDLGQDTWQAGFEGILSSEYVNNEHLDGIFDSDYKVDRKSRKSKLNEAKKAYIEKIEDKLGKDFDDMSEEDKKRIEKQAERNAKINNPEINRNDYDENQNKIKVR